MKRFLALLLVMLFATVAQGQQSIQTGPLQSGSPGVALSLTSANAAGVYYVAPAALMTSVEFKRGSAFVGTLFSCVLIGADTNSDGVVDAAAKCSTVSSLSGDTTVSATNLSRYFVLDIDTAESGTNTSFLTIRGSTSASTLGNELEFCNAGGQGMGYNPATRRWAMTCADFNWHGWRDSTQASASYIETCTAEGAPHASCVLAGEKIYVGYGMHRLALAAQYTDDGGRVITLPHRYNNNGAGTLQGTATRAKMPVPFDPEWEARPEFSILGYPTYLQSIQLARGVRVIGSGAADVLVGDPSNAAVKYNNPKFIGSWVTDDMGNGENGGTVTLDGVNSNLRRPFYQNLIGWNVAQRSYCHTTSTTNAACNREASVAAGDETFKNPPPGEYGYISPILANLTEASSAILCVNDTVAGTSPDTGSGMCRGNRMVTCWNGGAASGRNVGGCVFDSDNDGDFTTGDAGNLNLGVCESFNDSLQYDRETAKQDIQLRLDLPQCADDATSEIDCRSVNAGTAGTFIGWNSIITDIATPIGSWTGPLGQNGVACGAGGALIELGNIGGLGGMFASPLPRKAYYFNTGVVPAMTVVPVRRSKMDLRGAGFEGLGFAPSSWLGRTSTGLGQCLSGGDDDVADDEIACDMDTQMGFGAGYNGMVNNNLFYRAGYASAKSGIIETWAGAGGPNTFTRNRIRDAIRVNGISDWGDGEFSFNHISGVNINGSTRPLFACYSDHCHITDNLFERAKMSYGYGVFAGTTDNIFARNRYRQMSVGGSQNFYTLLESGTTLIEDEVYEGLFASGAPILRIRAGYGTKQRPTVIFRRNQGMVNVTGFGGSNPTSIVVIENEPSDTTRTESYRSIIIEKNHIISQTANTCLVWTENDITDAGALMEESAGRLTIRDNVLEVPTAGDIWCSGGYRATPGTIFTSANDEGPSQKLYVPTVVSNVVNSVQQLDIPFPMRVVANVPDADTLAEGTKVKVSDGAAACGHTTGVLTAGAVKISCTAHPNGAGDDGTWTAD